MGTIAGGSARNAVAAEVRLEGEVRSHVAERAVTLPTPFASLSNRPRLRQARTPRSSCDSSYAGYELAENDRVVALARRAFASLDGGGVSTLRAAAAVRMPTSSTPAASRRASSGIGAEACHSVHERISLAELELLTAWMLEIVSAAAQAADDPD